MKIEKNIKNLEGEMREIKFRAFSKVLGYMLPIMTMRELVESNGDTVDYEDLIIMQYTGLKDKNGVEIYEGDIVKLHHHEFPWIAKVYYKNAGFKISKTLGAWSDNLGGWNMPIEVIGNIYENSYLIKC